MHDALIRVAERVQAHAELTAVLFERAQLGGACLVRVRPVDIDCGRVVVFGGDELVHVARGAAGEAQAFERLRARHLVHEHQVDVQQIRSTVVTLTDQMISPDFLGQRHSHRWILLRVFKGAGACVAMPLPGPALFTSI
jgi:hypothetical protein